uniref:Putative transposase (Putative), gypsy type n=1 Tax=Tanacetum cinerariifolium TaxID=118510 RepID=A0A699GS30_TANCI|nr:putative transposase (putative), gypsy type [Tanacetum cinerariifolium]
MEKQSVVDLDEGDDDNMAEKQAITQLFGPDPKERPADKQRAKKKQKSGDTTSVGGSTGGSTVGSHSEFISGVLSQDYRRKCEAADKAYHAKREKEQGMMQCRELEFLMIDPSSLPPAKRAIIEMKEAEIMRKYPNAAPLCKCVRQLKVGKNASGSRNCIRSRAETEPMGVSRGSACDRDLQILIPFRGCLLVRERLGPNLCILFIMGNITDIRSVLTQKALIIFCETYHVPDEVHSQLPSPNQTIHEMPNGKIGVYTSKGVPKDPFPKSFEFNAKHFATLVGLPAPFHKYPKPFLCLVGISRYYILDEDAYPEFLGDNDEGMDLLAFIRTADPTKVRVAERQRAENEPRLLESTVERVVSLLPIAPARASSELEASVDKLFDEGASGDGQGADIQPVVVTTDTIVKDVDSLQPRRQRKRKTDVVDTSGPSHPPKKLREDYGALGGASIAGKSMSAVQSLFTEAVLNAEARGELIPTLPFVTSSVSATPEREDKSPADSVTRLNLRTIGAPQRFVISLDSSHHFGANIAEAEVDSIVRTDSVPGGFFDVSGSDFLIGGIRTVVDPDSDLQKVYVSRWSETNGFGLNDSCICREMLDEFAPPKFFASVRGMDHDQLFTEFNVRAARQISLNVKVGMRAEYNIREKMKLRFIVDEQAELLKVKDGEIESLKAQLLLKEAKAAEAICLRAEVFKFEAAQQSLRGEVGVLRDQSAALERKKNELSVKVTDLSASVKVHELEISSAMLQEKVAVYEDFVGQLEKFQDEKLEEVNEKFDKLCADFFDMALHLEEKFYPHLLTTIFGRRWLLTYGMKLVVVKFLNSTEYLSTLGATISKAVEKGMQEGLSAGITHGAKGRKLADVAAYNPSAEADYLSSLQHFQNVNFSLIAELKSNKDSSVDKIMNLLRLDDILAKRMGLTESQPHVNQLMVPIHHSPDQRVIGASALSLSLEVSHSRVKKMIENIAKHVLALRVVFFPLSAPLSDAALKGMKGTSGSTHDASTTLSTTFVSANIIPPISTDDYKVAHADGQGVPV